MRGFRNGLIYLSMISSSQDICILKFEKRVDFLGRFSPYEIPESGDKISKFSKLLLK